MISIIASIVAAIVAKVYVPFISPIFLLLRKKKNLAVIFFVFYAILLSYEMEVTSLYNFSFVSLAVLVSTIFLLEESLRGPVPRFVYFTLPLILAGIFYHILLFVGVTLAFSLSLARDKPRKGAVFLISAILLITIPFYFFKQYLSFLGGGSTEAVFIAGISLMATLPFWRKKISEFSGFP